LNKELTGRIERETSRLYKSLEQVKNDSDKEIGVKCQIDNLSKQVGDKMDQTVGNNKEIIRDVAQDVDHKLNEIECQV
jgi:hypothetical protein